MRQIFFLLMLFSMAACTSQGLDEARAVVAQADSVRAEGRMYDDSLQLAKAYTVLGRHPRLHADDYAHACYHYGRLLREKEDPAAAMQCFIRATHSHTHDLHILGRVYSNMGSICYMAGEYQQSYDMYKESADCFLTNGDTLNYFYALNEMAFQKAMLSDKESCVDLLQNIEQHCIDRDVICKTSETKAELYLKCKQYDSALYYANENFFLTGNTASALFIAQAYDDLGKSDSALIYANWVLSSQCSSQQEKFNAIYIVLHNDTTLEAESITSLASQREDIRYYEYEPKKEKLTNAVHQLKEDIARKPNLKWLYAIIATWMVVGAVISIYVSRKHKRKELLTQEIDELQQTAYTIREKHDALAESYQRSHKQIEDDINNKCALLQTDEKIKQALAWKNYNRMCKVVDKQFYLFASKLQSKQTLNETEIRLCILTLLDCGYDRMAELLFRSSASIGTQKMRVAKKLGTTSKQLRQYLIDNVCII